MLSDIAGYISMYSALVKYTFSLPPRRDFQTPATPMDPPLHLPAISAHIVIPAKAGIQGILGNNPHSGTNPPELKKLHELQ